MATKGSGTKAPRKSSTKGSKLGEGPCSKVSVGSKGSTLSIRIDGDDRCEAEIKVTCGRKVCILTRCVWNGSFWECSRL